METSTTTTSTTQQPGTDTGAYYLGLAREAMSSSTDYFDSSIRKQVESAIRQFQGVHPVGSKYHSDTWKTKSRLFRPKTRAMVRKAEAVAAEALFATADAINISAIDDNNKLQGAAAALLKRLMAYRLDKSIPWFLLAMGAYQDAMVAGTVISYQHWQYNPRKKKDQPAIELIPLENFRFDPGASWVDPINSSPYVIRLIPMFVKDVKAKMLQTDPKTGKPRWKKVEDSVLMSATSKNSDTTRQTRERGRTDSTQQAQAVREFAVVWVRQYIMDIDGGDMVWWQLEDLAMLTDPMPIEEVYPHLADKGVRPFTMGFSVIETHKTNPDGPVGITKDVQAEINEVTNQRIDNVKFAMNKRYFVKRTGQVDLRSITRNVPGSVTLLNDPEKDVKVQETQDVTGSAYQEQDRLNLDFDDVAGVFSPSSVQSNRKLNETVGGMQLLSVNTNQVGAYQLRTFCETWAEPTLRQVCWLEAYYETDEVLLRMCGEQAGLSDEFSVDRITRELLVQETGLRIDVGFGATNPAEQVNNFLTAMRALKELLADGVLEKYKVDIREVIKELFGKLGYRDGRRFFATENPALDAAMATIQELEQALSQKVSPQMVDAQVRKIEAEIEALGAKQSDTMAAALEKGMRAFFAAHQTGQMVAAVPGIAPVADALLDAAAVMTGNKPTAGAGPVTGMVPGPISGLVQEPIENKRTGIGFNPASANQPVTDVMPIDTTPNTPGSPGTPPGTATPGAPSLPAMQTPATGANAGIETMGADS
ncbi:MAG TPA: hypothetical protein VIL30_16715 [Ramlibacter sp.]|jgi:hypothetical protein